MTDQQLIEFTRETDLLLAALCVKHQADPLSLAAIVNARLIWMCREAQCEEQYHKLISTIQLKQYDNYQNTNIH